MSSLQKGAISKRHNTEITTWSNTKDQKDTGQIPTSQKWTHNGFHNNKKHPPALCGGSPRTQEGGGREKCVSRADLGGGCRGCAPPEMTCGFLIQLVFCKKKLCDLLEETSAPPPKKNPGSAPVCCSLKTSTSPIELLGRWFKIRRIAEHAEQEHNRWYIHAYNS